MWDGRAIDAFATWLLVLMIALATQKARHGFTANG